MTAAVAVWAAIGAWALLGAHASWTDLRRGVIRRPACWAAGVAVTVALALAVWALDDLARLGWTVAGAAAVAVPLEIAYRIRPSAIGYGDIRLIIVNSLMTGWWGPAWPWWALAAGAAAALPRAILNARRDGGTGTVRFAPALSLGAALIVAYRLALAGPTA